MGLVFQENEHNHLQKRTAIIVWINKASNQYKLRHYGDIIYFSRKNNYVILYCDTQQADEIIRNLNHKDFVKKAELSSHDQLNFSPEHEEKMMHELKEDAEKLREKKEDLRV